MSDPKRIDWNGLVFDVVNAWEFGVGGRGDRLGFVI